MTMSRRTGFTLIELVVVIMILGILAGVAAPKLFSTSSAATDNGLKQSLSIVRDAIELYAANNGGTMPRNDTSANFETDISTYIRGGKVPKFPISGTGSTSDAIVKFGGTADGTSGWMFNRPSGAFFPNSTATGPGGTAYSAY
jgi:general secretion pathway protein G